MHPAVLSNIGLSEFTLFMPDIYLKYENMKYENIKYENMKI
jgi:hypothetical protein